MSKIRARVYEILNEENLNIVYFKTDNILLQMISLELPNININDEVILHINPSHVAISKDIFTSLSHPNIIPSKVISVNKKKLLSTIKLEISKEIYLEALLTTDSLNRVSIDIDEKVFALINASEISISKKIL